MLVLVGLVVVLILMNQRRLLKKQEELKNIEIQFQKQITEAAVISAEQERTKVAENLHDDIGALLSVIRLNQKEIINLGSDRKNIENAVLRNDKLLESVIDNVRAISDDLHNPSLKYLGFKAALRGACDQIRDSNQVTVSYYQTNNDIELDSDSQIQLFRICKEILNNTLKHSKPKNIEVRVDSLSNFIIVTFFHDGSGMTQIDFDQRIKDSKGLGLRNLLSRSNVINASLEFGKEPDDKFYVQIHVPNSIKG